MCMVAWAGCGRVFVGGRGDTVCRRKKSYAQMPRILKKQGFTLIELLIVIAIIVVLSTICVPMYNNYVIAAKENIARKNLQSIVALQGIYQLKSGSFFPCPRAVTKTAQIDKEFFGGNGSLLSSNYEYEIKGGCNNFEASALISNSKAQCFKIDQNAHIQTISCANPSGTPEAGLPPGVKICPDSGCEGPYSVYVSDPCQNPYAGGHNKDLVQYFCDLLRANPEGVTCNNPHASRGSEWKGKVKKGLEGCP